MIEAWSTGAVYAAEGALMAALDDGELMARAVEGLAGVAAARLEECGGEAVAALVGPGNNGADALYAVARLAEAGWNAVAVHHDVGARRGQGSRGGGRRGAHHRPRGARRGRRRARRRPRHRGPARAARLGRRLARRALRERPRHRRRPALGPGPDGRRARPRRGLRRRDGDVLGRQAGAPAARRPSRRAGCSPSSTSASSSTASRSSAASTTTTSRRCGRCRWRPTTSTPAACWASWRVVSPTRAQRVLSVTAAVEAGVRHGPLRRHPDPHGAGARRRARGRARARPGAGLGGRPRPRRRVPRVGLDRAARRGPRGPARRGAGASSTPAVSTCSTPRCSRPGRMPSPSSPPTRASAPASSPASPPAGSTIGRFRYRGR